MKHNYFKHLFAVLLLLCSTVAMAHDFEVDGIYYNIINESDKTVEVAFKGDSYYSYYNEYTGTVSIPESVTYNGTTYSVTSIGSSAFTGCEGLTSIEIPNSVTSIEFGAFSGCTRLTSIIIEEGNSKYDSRNNCNAIIETGSNMLIAGCKNTIIPNNVTSIGKRAFLGCRSLTSITIPNSVTSIGSSAFSSCYGLTSITIPNSVTSIEDGAFENCTRLTSITIPNSVTSIEFGAFSGCTGLTSIIIEEGNSKYDSRNNCNAIIETGSNMLIAGCKNTIIPNNVTSIGKRAFLGCRSLTSITIPSSVTNIEYVAFFGCTGLTSIIIEEGNSKYDSRNNCNAIIETGSNMLIAGCKNTIIPNSVTSIGEWAFSACEVLTSITIPNSVTSIGSSAFSHCTGLTSITIPNSVTTIGSDAFFNTAWYNNQPDGIVYAGKVLYKYKGAMPENTSIVINDGTLGIAGGAFRGCTGLTSITIPNSVTTIGSDAFFNTAWYNNQPDGIVYAGKVLYEYKGAMPENTSIVINDGTLGIAGGAFRGSTGLTSITIPNSVTSIGEWAFCDCTGLTSITIPNSVTSIGVWAFIGCEGLTSIIIEEGNSKYDSRNNCNAIIETGSNMLIAGCKNTIIPNSVTSIGNGAFCDCTGLTSITIPNSVTSIGEWAFCDCTGLTSITIPNSVTNIGDYAFRGCTGLTSITIPNSVTNIGNYAFCGCTGLTSITIPNSVTSIGEDAFYGCTGLTSITIPKQRDKH